MKNSHTASLYNTMFFNQHNCFVVMKICYNKVISLCYSYKTNRKLFIDKVKESIASSMEHIYDEAPTDDKHYITFKPYDPNIHDSAKNVMLKVPGGNESSHGISWVQSGSYQSFSKEDDA